MATCKFCGKTIIYIKSGPIGGAKKMIAADPESVNVMGNSRGKQYITDSGDIFRGQEVTDSSWKYYNGYGTATAHKVHYTQCNKNKKAREARENGRNESKE